MNTTERGGGGEEVEMLLRAKELVGEGEEEEKGLISCSGSVERTDQIQNPSDGQPNNT
jgi:hypothetical protein